MVAALRSPSVFRGFTFFGMKALDLTNSSLIDEFFDCFAKIACVFDPELSIYVVSYPTTRRLPLPSPLLPPNPPSHTAQSLSLPTPLRDGHHATRGPPALVGAS